MILQTSIKITIVNGKKHGNLSTKGNSIVGDKRDKCLHEPFRIVQKDNKLYIFQMIYTLTHRKMSSYTIISTLNNYQSLYPRALFQFQCNILCDVLVIEFNEVINYLFSIYINKNFKYMKKQRLKIKEPQYNQTEWLGY